MGNTLEKKKKGFSLPHVYIVILILMLIITAMTYIIPAGTYARDAVTGAVDPDNFTYIDQTPVGFLQFFTSLHQGIVESSNIIGSVLLISGCIQIINMTGAFSAGIQALIQKTNGKGIIMVVLFFTLFVGLGVIGYLDALYPFYPIIISLFITLGYDKMVGTAVILLSTAVGFTCGMVNPYTTGVAQTLVGLPMYSGIGFRAVGLVVFYVIALFFLLRYCIQIKKNAKALAQALMDMGYKLCTDGTDNHLVLWDVRPLGLTGSKIEKVCDLVNISLNKNTVHGDRSAQSPGGVRIGTPALTTRGLKEEDFKKIAGFLDRAVKICLEVQKTSGKMLKDFVAALPDNKDIPVLAHDVAVFATSFPMPGFDTETMKIKDLCCVC